MKSMSRMWFVSSMTVLVAGCALGELGLYGQAREDYLKAIKSYGEYWVKDGMTVEQKRRDSWDCGAAPNDWAADRPGFTPAEIAAARRPEDPNNGAAGGRLASKWGQCMKAKGYEYRRTGPR